MGFTLELKRRSRPAIAPFLFAVAVAYFAFHFVQGDRGLIAYLRVNQQIEDTQAQLTTLGGERAKLEHRVGLLRPDHLDRDMLDERTRSVLGVAHRDEVIILNR
jgi:cell division protein FtsB